jgi:hypothetical protein
MRTRLKKMQRHGIHAGPGAGTFSRDSVQPGMGIIGKAAGINVTPMIDVHYCPANAEWAISKRL